jgi:hypothetical protein
MDYGWRVCWIGGWDKHCILFVVMVARKYERRRPHHSTSTCR